MTKKITVTFASNPPCCVCWGVAKTPYGLMLVGVTEEGALCQFHFLGKQKPSAVVRAWQRAWKKTEFCEDKKLAAQMAKRIFGKANKSVKVSLSGTPFQQSVWKALLGIPSGKVVSYADIARKVKKPKAVRAVGTALGANPVPILVPCHRVIASGGKTGGYTGGLAIKRRLLKAENAKISGG